MAELQLQWLKYVRIQVKITDTSSAVLILVLEDVPGSAHFKVMKMSYRLCSSLQFWVVCSMDHLLARLAIDSQSVSRRIVDLLFKSFFPVNESEQEWCSRCVTLIQMNPIAARKFYQFAHRHTAPTNISENVWKAGCGTVP